MLQGSVDIARHKPITRGESSVSDWLSVKAEMPYIAREEMSIFAIFAT
jgi:hypothetical protein